MLKYPKVLKNLKHGGYLGSRLGEKCSRPRDNFIEEHQQDRQAFKNVFFLPYEKIKMS